MLKTVDEREALDKLKEVTGGELPDPSLRNRTEWYILMMSHSDPLVPVDPPLGVWPNFGPPPNFSRHPSLVPGPWTVDPGPWSLDLAVAVDETQWQLTKLQRPV